MTILIEFLIFLHDVQDAGAELHYVDTGKSESSIIEIFKARGGRVSGLLRLRLLGWLSLAWNWIAAWLGGMGRLVYQSVREGVQKLSQRAPREAEASGWQYLNPRRLTARQRVQFYYLALVRRGTEKGIPRRPSQTPYEYAGSLSAAVEPELSSQTTPEEDIQAITEEFVQAQYTRHEITVHQANEVHRIWERLRRLFRKRRSSKQVDRRKTETT